MISTTVIKILVFSPLLFSFIIMTISRKTKKKSNDYSFLILFNTIPALITLCLMNLFLLIDFLKNSSDLLPISLSSNIGFFILLLAYRDIFSFKEK